MKNYWRDLQLEYGKNYHINLRQLQANLSLDKDWQNRWRAFASLSIWTLRIELDSTLQTRGKQTQSNPKRSTYSTLRGQINKSRRT